MLQPDRRPVRDLLVVDDLGLKLQFGDKCILHPICFLSSLGSGGACRRERKGRGLNQADRQHLTPPAQRHKKSLFGCSNVFFSRLGLPNRIAHADRLPRPLDNVLYVQCASHREGAHAYVSVRLCVRVRVYVCVRLCVRLFKALHLVLIKI